MSSKPSAESSAAPEDRPELVVLQSVTTWLPLTQTWLYAHLRELPSDVVPHVLCEQLDQPERSPMPHLHALTDLPRPRRLLERGLRKARLRGHLPFAEHVGRRVGARLLHSHFGSTGWRDLTLARALGVPQVVTFYGYDVGLAQRDARWAPRLRALFEQADRFLCEGPFMAERLVAQGAPPERVHVQHLGIDLAALPHRPPSWTPGRPLRLLIAGSFREKKGIPYALQAAAELRRRRPELDLQITVVGDAGGAHQAEKRRILQVIHDGGLADLVDLRGFLPYAELLALGPEHDLFLSPSVTAGDGDSEGGAPVTILEMAAMGLPVVATYHCDIPHVLQGPARRLLAPERDAAGLADILEQLVDDPEAWDAISRATRQRLEQQYDLPAQAEALAAHYRALV